MTTATTRKTRTAYLLYQPMNNVIGRHKPLHKLYGSLSTAFSAGRQLVVDSTTTHFENADGENGNLEYARRHLTNWDKVTFWGIDETTEKIDSFTIHKMPIN